MGNYSGLRGKVKVKKEFMLIPIHMISDDGEWSHLVNLFPFVRNLANKDRADEVPSRSPESMPDEWGDTNINKFNPVTREWEFLFSTKDPEDEIKSFMHDVLAKICDSGNMYHHYEEMEVEKQYRVKNGKIEFVNYLDIWTREHRDTPVAPREFTSWGY